MLHEIDIRLKLLAIFTALVFIALIIVLLKNRKLKENWAVIWIVFSTVLALSALNFNVVRWLSKLLGVADPNNTLFFISIVFIGFILILLSIEISDTHKKIKNLIQEVSVLKSIIEKKDKGTK